MEVMEERKVRKEEEKGKIKDEEESASKGKEYGRYGSKNETER